MKAKVMYSKYDNFTLGAYAPADYGFAERQIKRECGQIPQQPPLL